MTTSSKRATRRVTAADVARSLGVSRATVGFVLNDTPGQTISEATRQRVLEEAARLGYRPHTAARALASGRSRIVLLVLPEWPIDHAMRSNIEEAALALDQAGYSLVTMTSHPDGRAAPLWETLSPDVVISYSPLSEERYREIGVTGAIVLAPGRNGFGAASRDQRFAEGPRLQVKHMLETGRQRLAYALPSDPRLAELAVQRLELARSALRGGSGADFVACTEVTSDTASEIVSKWLNEGIEGVVSYNDDVAAVVLSAALRLGHSVPDELAIIGHDDSPLAGLLVPSLTSIRLDAAGLGRYLAHVALAVLDGNEIPTAGPLAELQLVRRETT